MASISQLISRSAKNKVLSPRDAMGLTLNSIKDLDKKLANVTAIIREAASNGETQAEVYSISTEKSSSPPISRLDNLGKVMLSVLGDSGYTVEVKEFAMNDTVAVYIIASWEEEASFDPNNQKSNKKKIIGKPIIPIVFPIAKVIKTKK